MSYLTDNRSFLLLILRLVKVKWGKEIFSDVEVDTDEDPVLFKAQPFALTGDQYTRQKVMVKGLTLKDEDWGKIQLKDVSHLETSL